MPIDIREFVIRTRVDPSADSVQDGSAPVPVDQKSERDDLVKICVKEVLRILEDKQER